MGRCTTVQKTFEHDHPEHLELLPRARLLEKSLVVVMTCAAGQRPVGQRV